MKSAIKGGNFCYKRRHFLVVKGVDTGRKMRKNAIQQWGSWVSKKSRILRSKTSLKKVLFLARPWSKSVVLTTKNGGFARNHGLQKLYIYIKKKINVYI